MTTATTQNVSVDNDTEYTKLSMEGKHIGEGAFVKTLQSEEGVVGFQEGTHVHKHWWKQTLDWDAGFQLLEHAADQREDLMVKAKDMGTGIENDEFVFKFNGRSFRPKPWALNTFSTRTPMKDYSSTALEKMDADTEDRQDAETVEAVVKNILRKIEPEKVFRVRTYSDGTMRAFLTDKYAPIDNRWYLEVLRRELPEARLSHWQGDEDTIYGNLLLPDSVIDYGQTDDSDYGAMLSLSNCEIGKRAIGQYPSIFRSICMNGCIWGQEKGKDIIRRVHRGKIDLEGLKVDIHDNIHKQLTLMPDAIRQFLNLAKFEVLRGVGLMKKVIAVVCDSNSFSRTEANEVLAQFNEFESDHYNAFGLLNAITRAGQTLSAERWVKFDEIAGAMITMDVKKWDSILGKAGNLSDEEMEKIFKFVKED